MSPSLKPFSFSALSGSQACPVHGSAWDGHLRCRPATLRPAQSLSARARRYLKLPQLPPPHGAPLHPHSRPSSAKLIEKAPSVLKQKNSSKINLSCQLPLYTTGSPPPGDFVMASIAAARYGKDNVRVYKVDRDAKTGVQTVTEMTVCVLLEGAIETSYAAPILPCKPL